MALNPKENQGVKRISLLEISHLTTKFETQQRQMSVQSATCSHHLARGQALYLFGGVRFRKKCRHVDPTGLLASNGEWGRREEDSF